MASIMKKLGIMVGRLLPSAPKKNGYKPNNDNKPRIETNKSTPTNFKPEVNFSIKIVHEEPQRAKKDASFEFNVLGQPCRVAYFSDWKYLETITDPEEYHSDPRRWADVFFNGDIHGYAIYEGCWTYKSGGLAEKDQIEYEICKKLGMLFPNLSRNEIETTGRLSQDKKYFINGKAQGLNVSGSFRHAGYIVELEINGFKARYNAKENKLSAPPRTKPAEAAISQWVSEEYSLLRPLNGILP